MGQRVLAAVPELYAQALSTRPWVTATARPVDRPILPAPAELGDDVAFELALLDHMPVGLGIYDGNGRLVHANPCFDRLVGGGRLPSRARAPISWTGTHADGGTLPMRDFPCERAMRGETVSPGVDLLHDKGDGQSLWLNVSAAPILDPVTNRIVGLVLLYLDTHDRVRESSFAAEAASRFEQFAEQSSTAIWIADAAAERFSYRNPRHLALAGGALGELPGIDAWLERIEEPDRAEVRRRYTLVQGGRTERIEYRIGHTGSDGGFRIEETCFPIFDDAGRVVSIGGMATEIASEAATILYLVGDPAVLGSPLATVRRVRGVRTKFFASLEQLTDVAGFLSPGCVIVDLAAIADARGGLERALSEIAATMPVIVIGLPDTGVVAAVDAMRQGAANYLIPPLADDVLTDAIRQASARLPTAAAPAVRVSAGESNRMARLSTREREVLAGLSAGGTNKSIARDLAISPRTVELYRARLMERMNAGSLAELLRLAQDPAT